MKKKTILIKPLDNVAVACEAIRAGESVAARGSEIQSKSDIALGHKIAIRPISEGKAVVKYGYPIGFAVSDITIGEHVHVHNIKTGLEGELEYAYEPDLTPPESRPSGSFRGFRRENGKVGIRNELWIIPTVGCVNSIGVNIARKAQHLVRGTIGGVYCFPHPYGCSQLGDDHEATKKALCGLISHPNAGGALVLGLGCENNTIRGIQEMLGHGATRSRRFPASCCTKTATSPRPRK